MAKGRFISKEISLDEKVNALSSDTVRLLWTWLIPHLDCEGRMYGDAQTVKSIVFPRRNIGTRTIERYLVELEEKGLILRYPNVDGLQKKAKFQQKKAYLCCPNFERHQVGLQKNKEAQSQIPAPTPELLQSYSRVTLTQVEVEDKVKDTTTSSNSNTNNGGGTENFYTVYEENIGIITPYIAEQLKDIEQKYRLGWFKEAVKEACGRQVRNLKYVQKILERWERDGYKTPLKKSDASSRRPEIPQKHIEGLTIVNGSDDE